MSDHVRIVDTKYSFLRPLLIVFVMLALLASKCGDTKCDVFARVSDQSGLDGCGLLFELEDDSLLLPANLESFDINLEEGDTVAISYEIIPDAMSVCMRENATITLTCLEVIAD